MDAVSDRDFVVEFLAACALISIHLSRLGEEIILWCSNEFGFLELDDSVATGSSIMPQKKNPDIGELARGKSGRMIGHLVAALTMLKGLPLAYNKDLQEDKEPVFDAVDTLSLLLPALTTTLQTARFDCSRMAASVEGDYSTAVDLADSMVKQGMPFREAHERVGRMVVDGGAEWPSPDEVVKARVSEGSASPESVRAQLKAATVLLQM
jgi:argininosuccinate lyase